MKLIERYCKIEIKKVVKNSMSGLVVDDLANRIIDLGHECSETCFADINEEDTFIAIEKQKNTNIKRATVGHTSSE